MLARLAGAAPVPVSPDLATSIILTPQGGSGKEDLAIREWQQRARLPEAKMAVFERLGWAYVAKARRTMDAGYYKLAEKTAEVMETRFGASAESKLLRGHVLHNLHRFAEAQKLAEDLVAERGSPADYGLLSDTLMEQGRLDEAVGALQKMVNLRPGLEAYSRIAHVRWLKGDLPGAIQAMEDAVHAGSPQDTETYSWVLSRISLYYLQVAQAPRALLVADAAVKYTADYPPALLARGRALLALGKNVEALEALARAAELNPLPEYQWWLADTQRLAGQATAAGRTEALLKSRGEIADPRTFALFLATRREDMPLALKLARAEIINRADVFSHDALAWAEAAEGDLTLAQKESALALAEHTADARIYFHAGEIALASGQPDEARQYLAKAKTLGATLTPSEQATLDKSLAGPAATVLPGAPENLHSLVNQ